MLLVLVCSPLREKDGAVQCSGIRVIVRRLLYKSAPCNSKNSSLLRALREGRANQSLGKALYFASC